MRTFSKSGSRKKAADRAARASLGGPLVRGVVAQIAGGELRVCVSEDDASTLPAELLVTSSLPIQLRVGDPVLCYADSSVNHLLIVGRIDGPLSDAGRLLLGDVSAHANDVPDTLVLDAKQSITLRVGDGSITLRDGGRILIKGKELVSHAQRLNRIKGGSVAIN
jgi:hypothetical protein